MLNPKQMPKTQNECHPSLRYGYGGRWGIRTLGLLGVNETL
ncbi:MAG: hypothetical protein UT33_C0006G0006 [Candidatus Peregrinibacteria bacterium GW2011_GWC2_39_14]|nr:MAG: hypothetical protein UT33_C0006G0006 [Candidatus Peregrinibacteria bacterium GW2011_GWC2_39_14]